MHVPLLRAATVFVGRNQSPQPLRDTWPMPVTNGSEAAGPRTEIPLDFPPPPSPITSFARCSRGIKAARALLVSIYRVIHARSEGVILRERRNRKRRINTFSFDASLSRKSILNIHRVRVHLTMAWMDGSRCKSCVTYN